MLQYIAPIMGSLLSGALNNKAAADRQDDAQAFSAQQFATRYQTTVKDMQAAGLNPMLAYQQGGGSAPTSSAASSAGYSDMGNIINQARMNSAQIANIDADTENKKAQAALIEAQVAQTRASAGNLEASTNLTNETVNKVRQEVENLKTDNDRVRAVIDNLRIEYDNLIKNGYNLTEVGNQLRASIQKMQAEIPYIRTETFRSEMNGQLLKLDKEAAEGLGNVGRETQQLKPLFDILRMFVRR